MFFQQSHRDGTSNSGMGVVGTLLIVVLAPIAAMIVQMAISRTREYAADNMGAQISGNPAALASALAGLTRQRIRSRMFPQSRTRRLRLCLSSIRCPGAHGQSVSTYPATENRVAALEQLAAQLGRAPSGLVEIYIFAAWTLGSTSPLGLSTAVRFRVNILIRFDSSYIRLPEFTPRLRPDVRFGSKANMCGASFLCPLCAKSGHLRGVRHVCFARK